MFSGSWGARHFGCRTCHRLSYRSRNHTKYRPLFRAQDIRIRLGGSASIYDPFPPKPKGMWWNTYRRLSEQEEQHYANYIQKA